MKICIVNPSRCGSTLLLSVLANRLKNYRIVYEVLDQQTGLDLLKLKSNLIFKYQYLWANKPLDGADKYIIADRKDLDAWTYSSYMSFVNHHHHGKIPVGANPIYKEEDYQSHKKNMLKLYNQSWIPERERLLKLGADIVWYEDIKDLYENKNIYFATDMMTLKLEKVWSNYAS